MNPDFKWQPLLVADLDDVNRIADQIHTGLPERPEVFEEKVRLFPAGCCKLVKQDVCVGYGISHPWHLNAIPPLDDFLVRLPSEPECLYIHDVVVMPEARGGGATGSFVALTKQNALAHRIHHLALVSVYGTDVLWSRFGFVTCVDPQLQPKLASYGASAKYMTCSLL